MEPLCDGVWAEPGLTANAHDELRRAFGSARRAITEAFGELRGPAPLTLLCRSAACKVAFGASPEAAPAQDLGFARDGLQTTAGFIARPTVVATGPGPRTARILAHEFVHAEMKAWLPYDSLPTWFNEGVATLLAGEPDCDAHPRLLSFDVTALDTKSKWQAHIQRRRASIPTYCQARDRVAAWAVRFGGPSALAPALRAVLGAVADGGSFDQAFAGGG